MSAYGTRSYLLAAEAAAEIMSQKLEILLSRPDWVGCSLMETLAKDAKAKLAMIQQSFSTTNGQSETTDWWRRFLQTMYDAEDVLDKFHLKVACRRHEALHIATWPVHNCVLWGGLSNLVKKLKDLCQDQYLTNKEAGGQRKKEPEISSSQASALWEGQKLARLACFWDRQAWTNYDCHETKKEGIMKLIKEELKGLHRISIWGDQGTGKTFFARWVYREAMYLPFDTRAWVHLPAINDWREFLFEILKQVGTVGRAAMDFNEITEMLRHKLAKPNRFLIVLDDVRRSHEQLLRELLKIIDAFSPWGYIITTTQDKTMASIMSDEPWRIHLEDLREEESQKMLDMKLRRVPQGEDKILNQIPALPLCISLLGGLLSNATEEERAALANNDSAITASDLLELSYHRLPVHLKPCFIYMALFPKASPISTRKLVRLWLAEGLLDSHCRNRVSETMPEDVGETFVLELADRNMIDVVSWRADGSPKACQMVISLNDMMRPIMMSMGFLHIHAANKSKDENEHDPTSQQQGLVAQSPETTKIRWLAEHTNIVTNDHSSSYPTLDLGHLSHLSSFLSFYMRRGMPSDDIGTFLRKMISKVDYSLLRVLDLEGAYQPSLQGVLRKLVLLRYLGLRSTLLDSIPSEVADLRYLETLDIRHTNITSLPSSLWKARNLRHLHLSWFYIDLKKILQVWGGNVMALTKLQTLSGLVIGEVKENSMTGFMNSLTTLKVFLQHSDKDTSDTAGKTIADWITSRLTCLQSLTFGVIRGSNPAEEAKLEKKFRKVAQPAKEAAKIAKPAGETELAKNAKPTKEVEPTKEAKPAEEARKVAELATPKVGLLPELRLAQKNLLELYLLGQLKNPIWTRLMPYSLRVLTLSGSKVEADMMGELGKLLSYLRTLRLLANSFQGNSLRFIKDGFPSLKILKIWKLPNLQKVIIEPRAMPHLKELEFRHLKKLETICGIDNCTELERNVVS